MSDCNSDRMVLGGGLDGCMDVRERNLPFHNNVPIHVDASGKKRCKKAQKLVHCCL